MKNNINKILSSVVAMILMITMVPNVHVFADDEGICGVGVTYSFDQSTGTLTIRGNGKMNDYQYEFIYYNDSYTHTHTECCAPWYKYKNDIKKVIIENGVTYIGGSAFEGCNGLKSVTIPGSVVSIGDFAFKGCTNLTEVNYLGTINPNSNNLLIGTQMLVRHVNVPNNYVSNYFCGLRVEKRN